MRIYKYTLEVTDYQSLALPINAQILDIQAQNETICLWAIVDESAPPEHRYFAVYGTGHPLPDAIGLYLATVQRDGFVWHIFELVK